MISKYLLKSCFCVRQHLATIKMSNETVRKILDYAATRYRIENWSYVSENLDERIENYFGVLIPVTLRGLKDDVDTLFHVMVKMPPPNPTPDLLGIVQPMYEREICVYEKLLPIYESLKTNIDIKMLVPECYYLNLNLDEASLVLADMRYKGFIRCKNEKYLDFEHMKTSLRSLAQFHALSIISQEKGILSLKNDLLPSYESGMTSLSNAVQISFDNNSSTFSNTDYYEFVNYIQSNVDAILKTCALSDKAKRIIYGHGDFWRENILFKYTEGKPTKACLIDFQGTREMSPAQDVLYFILCSAEPSTRRLNFKKYIDIYYTALTECLSVNNVRTDVYSQTDLEDDLKYVAPVSFLSVFFAFAMWNGLNTNTIVKSKTTHGSETERINKEKYFKELIMGVIDDLKHYGLLD